MYTVCNVYGMNKLMISRQRVHIFANAVTKRNLNRDLFEIPKLTQSVSNSLVVLWDPQF